MSRQLAECGLRDDYESGNVIRELGSKKLKALDFLGPGPSFKIMLSWIEARVMWF
jgi:hypothetical protein